MPSDPLEREVESLTEEELDEFRHWFLQFEAAAWDAQIEDHVAAGRLDALGDQAADAVAKGDVTEL
jgi:hypothetical protein